MLRAENVLTQDKAPYLLTLAVALIGWCGTRAIDRVTDAPTVGYSMESDTSSDGVQVKCYVKNLSHASLLSGLVFVLEDISGGKATAKSGEIEYPPPTWIPSLSPRKSPSIGPSLIIYDISRLQPGDAIVVKRKGSGLDGLLLKRAMLSASRAGGLRS